MDLLGQAVEVGHHEAMPIFGYLLARWRQHSIFDLLQLHGELPKGGVLGRVGLGGEDVRLRVVQPGPYLPCEQKGPAYAHGPDRIELVRVEQDAGLERPGLFSVPAK